MRPPLENNDVMTVQEAIDYYRLSRRKFYACLILLLMFADIHIVPIWQSPA